MSTQLTKKQEWSIIARWIVGVMSVFSGIGVAILLYAGESYISDIAHKVFTKEIEPLKKQVELNTVATGTHRNMIIEAVKEAIDPIAIKVQQNTLGVQEFRLYKAEGDRFTASDAQLLKSQAIATAVLESEKKAAEREARAERRSEKIDERLTQLYTQMVDLKIITISNMNANKAYNEDSKEKNQK